MSTLVGGTVVWNLDVDASALDKGLSSAREKIDRASKDGQKSLDGFAKSITKSFDSAAAILNKTGDLLLRVGAAPTAALGFAAKAAISFEDTLADVRKTTGLTADQTQKLGKEILTLGDNTRTSNKELLDIAKIAGQLGVSQENLLSFTQSVNQAVVALGDEFTGGAEQVTKELGILSNQFKLTGKDGSQISRSITQIGSALNSLAASGQATAPFITDFSNRVGGIAPVVGLSIDKVLGLGAALQELGQSPEVAGTAIQSLLVQLGKNTEEFAKIAGVSTKEFSQLLKTDINEALLLVASGVTESSVGIEELAATLDGLGIDGNRTVGVLANLGNNTDLVRKRQALANAEYAKGTSLIDEYNIKNETTAANFGKTANQANKLAITLGTSLLPAINNILDAITPLITGFSNFAAKNPEIVTSILGLGAALAGLGVSLKVVAFVFSGLSTIIAAGKFIASLAIVKGIFAGISAAATAAAAAIGVPVAAIVAAIALVIGSIVLLAVAWNKNWFDIQGKTESAIAFIKSAFEAFISAMGSIAASIGTKLNEIRSSITTWGSNTFRYFQTEIPRWVSTVMSFFTSLPGRIASALSSLGSQMSQSFRQAFDQAVREIQNFPGRIYDWGRNIANSFVDGIRNGLGGLRDAFNRGLNDARSSIQGNSPPKDGPFKNIDVWGYNVGQAWVEGMNKAIAAFSVQATSLQDFSNSFPDMNVRQTQSFSLDNQQSTQPLNQNINVSIDRVNSKQDVDMISREIAFKAAILPAS